MLGKLFGSDSLWDDAKAVGEKHQGKQNTS
jgi:hypothetical protein